MLISYGIQNVIKRLTPVMTPLHHDMYVHVVYVHVTIINTYLLVYYLYNRFLFFNYQDL